SGRGERDNLLDMIQHRNSFTSKHKIRFLRREELQVPLSIQNQMETRHLSDDIDRQFKERDIILFKHKDEAIAYGCLIFPSNLAPYYTITPHIVNSVLATFARSFH
ncbi:MAG: hypothetical protein ACFFBD_23595, partial [Candidatus Hodarchaeota archaeon]